MRYSDQVAGRPAAHPIEFQAMAVLNGSSELVQVGAEPVISVAQQMAFYFSVAEDEIHFDSSDENSCTIQVEGNFFDVFFDPITSIVTDWFPA